MPNLTISDHHGAVEIYRNRSLRQALYDAGEVVMGGVLVNLHGDEHRRRRRLENQLYRRDTLLHYERDLFPAIVESTLRPHAEAGRAELVAVGHQLMMNLAATTAGVDRPQGTPEETQRLYEYLRVFIEGATLAHHTGDRAAKAREVQDALEQFDADFLDGSVARRRAALDAGEALPRDILSVLIEHEDELGLSHEILRREVAFYLLAGAHTSATAFTRVTHNILRWLADHPEDRASAEDLEFVQRCTNETVRLEPSSPIALRRAVERTELSDGTVLEPGDEVTIDLLAVNRDSTVWGSDADRFDPHRATPEGVAAWGLSFGHGMHHCIGQDLAAGAILRGEERDERLWGLVPVSVHWLLANGCRPDPDDPPQLDPTTARPYFARHPVLLGPS